MDGPVGVVVPGFDCTRALPRYSRAPLDRDLAAVAEEARSASLRDRSHRAERFRSQVPYQRPLILEHRNDGRQRLAGRRAQLSKLVQRIVARS